MYLPPAWATDSRTSVGALSSAGFYGGERVLLGFPVSSGSASGLFLCAEEDYAGTASPHKDVILHFFVTSWWFAVIYKHPDAYSNQGSWLKVFIRKISNEPMCLFWKICILNKKKTKTNNSSIILFITSNSCEHLVSNTKHKVNANIRLHSLQHVGVD